MEEEKVEGAPKRVKRLNFLTVGFSLVKEVERFLVNVRPKSETQRLIRRPYPIRLADILSLHDLLKVLNACLRDQAELFYPIIPLKERKEFKAV